MPALAMKHPIELRSLLTVTLAAFLLTSVSAAQCEEAILRADDFDDLRFFGYSTAIDGDTAVVGAPNDSRVEYEGAVYIFQRDRDAWVQRQKLVASDATPRALFGFTVAIDGDTLLVGALGVGQVYVFTRNILIWSEEAILSHPDAGSEERFGVPVDVSNNRALVGAQLEDTAGFLSGAAYVFAHTGSTWSFEQKLVPDDGAALDAFGVGAIHNSWAVIGSPGDDGLTGSAYVFYRTGTVWAQTQKLTAKEGNPRDVFGRAVALDGETVVVGSYLSDASTLDAGEAHVFERQGFLFGEPYELVANDAAPTDGFGACVSISGNALLVSAPGDDDAAPEAGSAYLFTRDDTGTGWVQRREFFATDGDDEGQFCQSSISGDTLLLGATKAGGGDGRVLVVTGLGPGVRTFNGTGTNRNTLTATPARLGTTWRASVDVRDALGAGEGYVVLSSTCSGGVSLLGGSAEILVGGPRYGIVGPVLHAGRGSTLEFSLALPPDPVLSGLPWAAQGVLFGTSCGLTNAAAGLVW